MRSLRVSTTLNARISFLKTVPAKTALSYGRSFTTRKTTRIATITAGYGDGYLRAGSNRAKVLINGTPCRVLGRITMDQMLVDVTALNGPSVGDEVVLLGCQGKQQIRANDLAAWCATVPWEILTNISHRVPRVYLGQQAA